MSEPVPYADPSTPSGESTEPKAPGLIEYLTTGTPAYVVLGLLVAVCFGSMPQFAYLWRDDVNLTANATLRTFGGLSRIWTELSASPQFMPATFTSYWAEVRLFGVSSIASHAFNVLLHLINALLLLTVLKRLAVPGAWVAAAIFAVHPLNVETVAWVSQRSSVLSLTFALAATYFYLRMTTATVVSTPTEETITSEGVKLGLPEQAGRLYGLFLAMFVLAVLARPTMAVLPLVLATISWWKQGRLDRRAMLGLIAPLVIGIAVAAIAVYVEHDPAAHGAVGKEFQINPAERLQLVGQTIGFYAMKLVAPFPLIFNYPRWTLDSADFRQWLPLVGVVAALVVAFALVKQIGRGTAAALLIFVLAILPMSGIVSFYLMRFAWVWDHVAYAAIIAPIALIVAALATAFRRAAPVLPNALALVVIAVLAFLTATETRGGAEEAQRQQQDVTPPREPPTFAEERFLWEKTLRQNGHSWLAASEYGNWATLKGISDFQLNNQAGDPERATKERALAFQRARIWLDRALKLNPDCYEAYNYRGVLDQVEGKPQDALADFLSADNAAERMSARAYFEPKRHIAELLARRGDIAKAKQAYQEMQDLEPTYAARQPQLFAAMRVAYGDLLLRGLKSSLGPKMPDADRQIAESTMGEYLRAIDIAPDFVLPKLKLAKLLIQAHRPADALEQLRDAVLIDKKNVDAKYLVAIAAQKLASYETAGAQLIDLLQTDPKYLPAYTKLAEVYLTLNRRDDAANILHQALTVAPGYAPAQQMLAQMNSGAAPTSAPTTEPDLPNLP